MAYGNQIPIDSAIICERPPCGIENMFQNSLKARPIQTLPLRNPVDGKSDLLRSALIAWGALCASVVLFMWLGGVFDVAGGYYYLVPWSLATAALLLAPIVYQFVNTNSLDPFHPLIFASWSYFFPGFAIGGFVLALGYSQPYYLSFVVDERYNLPLTFLYVIIGYGGLMVGFFIPFGRQIGAKIASRLPVWNWTPEQVLRPAFFLLMIGLAYTIIAFASGLLGYQKVQEIGRFDGLILVQSSFWYEASFVLWVVVFRAKKLNFTHYAVIAILLATSLGKSAFQGNRGSLISIFTLVAFAYVCSGKKIGPKQSVVGGLLILLALIVGMIYGTTFRSIKVSEDRMEIDQYASVIGDTIVSIGDQDLVSNLGTGFEALAGRLDSITPLAVVVSNYEKLGPYEEAYGISNNIWNEAVVFAIPRFIWPDKPIPTSPEKYADLYFNFPNNSFTLTPMGDLLRNFGPWGVPLGMIFLGFMLRVLYSAFRENQPFSFARVTLFYMLLTSVSYEGSYGLIIPVFFKLGLISVIGVLIIRFFAGRGQSEAAA